MSTPRLTILPKREGRVQRGHPWIFSNELEKGFADLPPGTAIEVFEAKGRFVGKGLISPNSLIAVRLLTRQRHDDLDDKFFYIHRLRAALGLRNTVMPGRKAYRLLHAEGDDLPGLVIDRFGDHLAVQINTVGLERRKDLLQAAIEDVMAPAGVVLRNDNKLRELEGLEQGRSEWFGEVPEHVDIDERGVTYRIPLLGGQKTGHFFDQAENRHAAGRLCNGADVLDVFANTGGFALQALRQGAKSAIAVEKSEDTAEIAGLNGELNGVSDRLQVVAAEATTFMESLVNQGRLFDVVCIDPPAFAKSKKTAGNALRGYSRVNALAMTLVRPGGLLFTSSCSYHIQEDRFDEAIDKAATLAERHVRVVRRGGQAADHPVMLGVPETRYLKHLGLQVVLP